jgi:hypothetical protein
MILIVRIAAVAMHPSNTRRNCQELEMVFWEHGGYHNTINCCGSIQVDCDVVKIDLQCAVRGDVVMECINLEHETDREEMMFRVMFNTAFIRSNILILTRDDIDILWNAKERFPKDFRAEVSHSCLAASQLCALYACNSQGFMRSVMCCGWTHMRMVPWPTNSHLIFLITFYVCLCFSSWKKKNISPSVTKGQWTHGLHDKRFDLQVFGFILPQILT